VYNTACWQKYEVSNTIREINSGAKSRNTHRFNKTVAYRTLVVYNNRQ